MKELETLAEWLEELRQELEAIERRRKAIAHLMGLQGYSLKTIKNSTYLYVWKTTGHAKARRKSLGNIDKIDRQVIEEVRDAKVMVLAQEYALLEKRQKRIRELLSSLVLAIEEDYGQVLEDVV